MTKDDESAVVRFVSTAWANAGGEPLSWLRFNQQLFDVCHLAAAGFLWNTGDLDALDRLGYQGSRIARCLGADGHERLYATAVNLSNMSACVELERYLGRPPIIADGANGRERDRLCLGSEFTYGEGKLRVTSFRRDGKAVCITVRGVDRKLYRIGPSEIKVDRAKRKKQ